MSVVLEMLLHVKSIFLTGLPSYLSLTAGGYIDTNDGTEKFGGFTVPVNELDLFNFDQSLKKKLQDVKDLVNGNDEGNCDAVLEYFHSACDRKRP